MKETREMYYYRNTILKKLPGTYKLKYEPFSLTTQQQLGIIKIFLEKDEKRDGQMPLKTFFMVIKENLGFKVSEEELKRMLLDELNMEESDKTVDLSGIMQIVDILKREKLVLVQLGNSLNYIIFIILVILIILYLSVFYDYKSRNTNMI